MEASNTLNTPPSEEQATPAPLETDPSTQPPKTERRSMSVAAKITAVVALCLLSLAGTNAFGIFQMQRVNYEIVAIADRDIPMTEQLQKITVHKLEVGISFERTLRYGEEMAQIPSAKSRFEKSRQEFSSLSTKLDKEIGEGISLASQFEAAATTEESRKEFSHVTDVLKAIQKTYKDYTVHVAGVAELLASGNVAKAREQAPKVEVEEKKLNLQLEGLLFEVSKFTAQAANTAKAVEKFAIQALMIASVSAFIIAGLLAGLIIIRAIARPLRETVTALDAMSAGDLTVDINPRSNDEVGRVAKGLQIFQQKLIEAKRLEAETAELEKQAAEAKTKAVADAAEADRKLAAEQAEQTRIAEARAEHLTTITAEFDLKVNQALEIFASAATELDASAQSLTRTASETTEMSTNVANASNQASGNVQTVAAATEELASSIQEISRQVTESARVSASAVDEAEKANGKVQSLAKAASKIGEVISLITDIASQTNLLALNATIEAARAGEAGKGFAVVATEVKSLADQTAKATDEIGDQIAAIQGATNEAVDAIDAIGKTIKMVDEISSSIAAAVEEQGTATNDISVSVQQASTGTQEVDSGIVRVREAADETGESAKQVLATGQELNEQATMLRSAVDDFLTKVKAA